MRVFHYDTLSLSHLESLSPLESCVYRFLSVLFEPILPLTGIENLYIPQLPHSLSHLESHTYIHTYIFIFKMLNNYKKERKKESAP